jgi:tetratricopeptide (TPR) repeat protein
VPVVATCVWLLAVVVPFPEFLALIALAMVGTWPSIRARLLLAVTGGAVWEPGERAQGRVDRARELVESPGEALKLLDEAIPMLEDLDRTDRTPATARQLAYALRQRGRTYAALDRHEEALADLDRALELAGDRVDEDSRDSACRVNMLQAWCFCRMGRETEGLAKYEEIVRTYGDDKSLGMRTNVVRALVSQGAAYGELGRELQSLESTDRALQMIGDDPDPELGYLRLSAMFNRVHPLVDLGRTSEAIEVARRVVETHADAADMETRTLVADALIAQGMTLARLAEVGPALEAFERVDKLYGTEVAGALNERVAESLVERAGLLELEGRTAEARTVCDQVAARSRRVPSETMGKYLAQARDIELRLHRDGPA